MSFPKLAAIALAAFVCAFGQARGQEQYPNRLITIVAPITAGTAIDIMARLYADKLSKRFGQQVVVANRAGAGGLIGAQAVASAPADGYTVLFVNSGHAILGTLNRTCRSTRSPISRACRWSAKRRVSSWCCPRSAFRT